MHLYYFSWLRNRIGKDQETLSPPAEINSIQKLIDWLSTQNASYKNIFSYGSVIQVSVNDEHVDNWSHHPLKEGDKICFFSALAGG